MYWSVYIIIESPPTTPRHPPKRGRRGERGTPGLESAPFLQKVFLKASRPWCHKRKGMAVPSVVAPLRSDLHAKKKFVPIIYLKVLRICHHWIASGEWRAKVGPRA